MQHAGVAVVGVCILLALSMLLLALVRPNPLPHCTFAVNFDSSSRGTDKELAIVITTLVRTRYPDVDISTRRAPEAEHGESYMCLDVKAPDTEARLLADLRLLRSGRPGPSYTRIHYSGHESWEVPDAPW